MEIFSITFPDDWNLMLLKALLALIIPVLIGMVLSSSLKRIGSKQDFNKNRVYQFFSYSVRIVALIFGIISALGTLGINVSVLIASLGLTGLGLSLALKDTISNFIAGLMLIIYNPFSLESTIKVGDAQGKVIQMDLRYVHIKTETDTTLIPNATFLTSAVKVIDEVKDEES